MLLWPALRQTQRLSQPSLVSAKNSVNLSKTLDHLQKEAGDNSEDRIVQDEKNNQGAHKWRQSLGSEGVGEISFTSKK